MLLKGIIQIVVDVSKKARPPPGTTAAMKLYYTTQI